MISECIVLKGNVGSYFHIRYTQVSTIILKVQMSTTILKVQVSTIILKVRWPVN